MHPLLLLYILFSQNQPGLSMLIRQSLEDFPNSLCTDGSPASYFHSWDYNQVLDYKKFIIYLQPGGYCHSVDVCNDRCRIAPFMCEPPTNKWMDNQHGLLSDDQDRNPYFYDYVKVVIPYCSADMFVGRRPADDASEGYSFMGKHILTDTITSLDVKFKISEADRVIYAGSSAGGAGVAFNCNYMMMLLSEVPLYCVVDGAFFYPRNSAIEDSDSCDTIDNVLNQGASFWSAPEIQPFNIHTNWWRDLVPPVFLSVAGVDQFGFESYCGDVNNSSEKLTWSKGTRSIAKWITESDERVGLFMPSCFDHMLLLDDEMFHSVTVGPHNSTLSETLLAWIQGQRNASKAWDDCELDVTFCNTKCPNNKETYSDLTHVRKK